MEQDVPDTLAAALEREHREIDRGVEAYLDGGDATSGGAPEGLRRAMEALRRHIYLEEEFLFPPLREAGMFPPIFVMLREHGELWQTMETIDGELGGPADAVAVRGLCRQLLAQLEQHNSKEEPIIYPHVDTVPAAAGGELRSFLASGRMPDGWVCAGASAAVKPAAGR